TVDNWNFLVAFPRVRMEAFKPNTIRSGFAISGLVPLDPHPVLQNLNIQVEGPTKAPTLPGSLQGYSDFQNTPYNSQQLQRKERSIKKIINQCCLHIERIYTGREWRLPLP
ncbi:hypothetical protein TSTA_078570, partial [Talaromyces stipitatus ATCC 10500]